MVKELAPSHGARKSGSLTGTAGRPTSGSQLSSHPPAATNTHLPDHTVKCMHANSRQAHSQKEGSRNREPYSQTHAARPFSDAKHAFRAHCHINNHSLGTHRTHPPTAPDPTRGSSLQLVYASAPGPRSPRIPRPERWAPPPTTKRGRREAGAVAAARGSSSWALPRPGRHRRRGPPKAARRRPWQPPPPGASRALQRQGKHPAPRTLPSQSLLAGAGPGCRLARQGTEPSASPWGH